MHAGAIKGVFHAARVIAAINEPNTVGAVCFERFVFADPQMTDQPNDWWVISQQNSVIPTALIRQQNTLHFCAQ
jgi:hypothetical protein